jgi:hypothetical protein
MSSSLSEEKENVNITNEFAKEDKVSTASSVLKPSQKENVFSSQQLTPKKPPKVSSFLSLLKCLLHHSSSLEIPSFTRPYTFSI